MQFLKHWLKVIFAAAVIGTVMRFVFFILLAPKELQQISPETPYFEILKAFVMGFRFDLSALCYLTVVFWLISLILSKRLSLLVWKTLLTTWSFLLIVDIGYYSFYNDRINILVFGLFDDDTWALVKTFWKNYPVIWILFLTFIFGVFFNYIVNKNFPITKQFGNRISPFSTRLIVFILLFIGARGTFALFPLGDHDTVVSSRPFLNTLSFGTAHSFSRALKLRKELKKSGGDSWNANLKEFGYLNKEDQAFEDFFQKKINLSETRYDLLKQKANLNIKLTDKPHVVLIVMESWGYYGLQFQKPEFDLVGPMKKHFAEDLLNIQFLSATGATTGSLSCLLAGIPQRPISGFLTETEYLKTALSTSPALTYKKAGYQTHFIYGGNPGWRDMNKYALAQGFDVVEGEIDIEKKLAAAQIKLAGRHDWGVYDEDVFKYVQELLKDAKTPQMMVVMTTTNHPPYELPSSAKNHNLDIQNFAEKNLLIDSKLAQGRFTTFRYSSDVLSDFLDSTKADKNFGPKTVVAVTADHTFWVRNFAANETFMRSAVPFYLYLPANLKNQLPQSSVQNFKNSFGSHQDIWPTLYNLTLPETTYDSFGRSLFEPANESFAFTFGQSLFTKDRAVYVLSGTQFSSFQAANEPFIYNPTEAADPKDAELSQKYRALMGSLDSYLHHSKIKP